MHVQEGRAALKAKAIGTEGGNAVGISEYLDSYAASVAAYCRCLAAGSGVYNLAGEEETPLLLKVLQVQRQTMTSACHAHQGHCCMTQEVCTYG